VIAPGVIGGICAVLALYAMHLLPVNFAGVVLICSRSHFFHNGGEIRKSRRSPHWRHRLHVSGRDLLIRSPLTPGGVSTGVALA